MIKANEAIELSDQGVCNQKILEEDRVRKEHENWLREEREKNPERIQQAEQSIRKAASLGKRMAEVMTLCKGVDFKSGIEDVRPPFQELIDSFRANGYQVILEPLEMDPQDFGKGGPSSDGYEAYGVVLRW